MKRQVLKGTAYTVKADVFSFSMVAFEAPTMIMIKPIMMIIIILLLLLLLLIIIRILTRIVMMLMITITQLLLLLLLLLLMMMMMMMIIILLMIISNGRVRGLPSPQSLRGWRSTFEPILFEISNSMKPNPYVFHAYTIQLRPVIGISFELTYLDEVSSCIPPTSQSHWHM